jgi:hypothetical protein
VSIVPSASSITNDKTLIIDDKIALATKDIETDNNNVHYISKQLKQLYLQQSEQNTITICDYIISLVNESNPVPHYKLESAVRVTTITISASAAEPGWSKPSNKKIAQQVANANPGTNADNVYQILVQLAKQTAQTANKEQAIQEIHQISSQVAKYPFEERT